MNLDALLDAYGDEVDGEFHIPARGGVGAGEGVGLFSIRERRDVEQAPQALFHIVTKVSQVDDH